MLIRRSEPFNRYLGDPKVQKIESEGLKMTEKIYCWDCARCKIFETCKKDFDEREARKNDRR